MFTAYSDAVRKLAPAIEQWLCYTPEKVAARVMDSPSGVALGLRSVSANGNGTKRDWNVLKAVNVLESHIESTFSANDKRKLGIAYTPPYIREYLISESMKVIDGPPRFLDPSCGGGGFTISAIELIHQKYGIPRKEIIETLIVSVDKDPQAVEYAEFMLSLYLAVSGEQDQVKSPFRCADSLLSNPMEFLPESLNEFDLIATNPPYVKIQNIGRKERQALEKKYQPFIQGSYSTTLLFVVRCLELLSGNGQLAFITQNNFFTSIAGQSLRRLLTEGKHIRRILDFGHRKVFSKASAYTCLLFAGRKPEDCFEFARLHDKPGAESLARIQYEKISHSELRWDKWRLANQPHRSNLGRLESEGTPLGQLCQIKVGFATLKDVVFLLKEKIAPGKYRTQKGEIVEIEKALLRPAIKIADLQSEDDLEACARHIIFPYKKVNGAYAPIPEEELKRRYPKGYSYLLANRELLAARNKGRLDVPMWYSWGRTQGMEAKGPKLLTKTFNAGPNFMFDPSNSLFCNGYSVSLRDDEDLFANGFSLRAVQAVLNSPLMDYYARLTSFQIDGNYQCFQKNFIERFCIVKEALREIDGKEAYSPDLAGKIAADASGISWKSITEAVDQCR